MKYRGSIRTARAFALAALLWMAIPAGAATANMKEPASGGWADMSSGGSHRLALKLDGTLWAWGSNRNGQLGTGQFGEPEKLPVQVPALRDVAALGTGQANSYAIMRDGSVWAWGDNTDGQLGDGTVTRRQIGSGDVSEQHNASRPIQLKELSHIVSITGNFAATYAVQDDGSLWAWGFVSIPYTTQPVQLKNWTNIQAVATGYTGSLIALRKDGTVLTVSAGGVPEQVTGLDHIVAVATSIGSYFALKDDGTVWVWGSNAFGQLGDGTTEDRPEPIQAPYIRDVAEIQGTQGGPIYLKKDGTVWAGGSNLGGQLGIGSYADSKVPVQVKGLTHIRHITASGTGNNVMALREDHTLWGWGDGYIGDGTEWWRTVPVLIKSDPAQPDEAFDTIKVDVDGRALTFEQFPQLIHDTTMVPMRAIFEKLGAQIAWDPNAAAVTASKDGLTLRIAIGANVAEVNGESIKLDTPAVLLNGTTLIPVRFVAESLGAKVGWDNTTHTVSIESGKETETAHE
ncbi:hypothetical protein B5M42_023385 [Paenibacillus athensensis]|uniref:stalk domain-containing protein n=1 Tax=Paenibacillus athensensis TaxID=1967502 RepID=UPI001430C5BB|nr:stalk domain-containing protein [Paenibacillus athensensis]MCD1261744.1 hypothetical protein [Paenibacillus athensensis]